jgi:hypothetical protein
MHSGIGDPKTLIPLGIPSLLDLKSVGANASDQPIIGAGWSVNSTQTVGSISGNITRYNEAFAQWNRTQTGPFVELGLTHIAWLRLDDDSPIFDNVTDPSAGPDTPHIEMAMGVRIRKFRMSSVANMSCVRQAVQLNLAWLWV